MVPLVADAFAARYAARIRGEVRGTHSRRGTAPEGLSQLRHAAIRVTADPFWHRLSEPFRAPVGQLTEAIG